ncbi:hypothetical protein [Mariniphaga sp.]|uniref:hypothetical protein n=1 Tax=Mariniphaga sp. TaxID=1954475 RepID=UPI0035670E8A
MGSKSADIPIVYQFIGLVQNGFATLDADIQSEVKEFVQSCQHSGGGFTNRAGRPDLYYSLFGVLLSNAFGLEKALENHRRFILENAGPQKESMNTFADILIRKILFNNEFKKPSKLKLLRMAIKNTGSVSIFYRIFLFLITFDVLYQNVNFRLLVRLLLSIYSPSAESPCSFHAAVLTARQKTGLSINKESKILLSFFEEGKGFKTFRDVNEPDLLSTGVALFSLKFAGTDLRLVTPTCLELVQQNYSSGAFLAGNGDEKRDLEYTFYGLLALGTLV